jgi:lysophospholipase L1-like esterase
MAVRLVFVCIVRPDTAARGSRGINYTALGDSIAAGQTPYGVKVGTGYTDMIAAELEAEGYLSSFTKEFALSGETSTQFLAKLSQLNVQEAVQEAELITISTGANDLLQIAAKSQTGTIDQTEVITALQTVSVNLKASIARIQELNPEADVYLVGYYFPFPYAEEGQTKELLKQGLSSLNLILANEAAQADISYVDVASAFDLSGIAYLPNPADVHPNEAGYELIADQFFKAWQKGAPFTDISTASTQARTAITMLSQAGIIKGKEDGTFAPNSPITRVETAIILANIFPDLEGNPKKPGFKDVSKSMSSYEAIAKLTQARVFLKAPAFHPYEPLTRAQMAAVLVRSYNLQSKGSSSFKDVPSTCWAKNEIDAVVSNGVMIGGTNSMFYPGRSITRAEFAISMYNLLQRTYQ